MNKQILTSKDVMDSLTPVISLVPSEYQFLLEKSIKSIIDQHHKDLMSHFLVYLNDEHLDKTVELMGM